MNLIVDATNLLTRSFYAYPENDTCTWGIIGFVNMILDTIKYHQPKTIHFCFDAPNGNSWRRGIYPAYKMNRKEKPESLSYQLELAQSTMVQLGLSVYQQSETEADDLIATLCWLIEGHKTLLSSDKDLMQLLDWDVEYFRYTKQFRYHELLTYKSFILKYGFKPSQWVDWLALVGDSADNIPGVRGIGPVGATLLIQEYNSLSNMFALAGQFENLKKIGANKEIIEISYKLIKLGKKINLDVQNGSFNTDQVHQIRNLVLE